MLLCAPVPVCVGLRVVGRVARAGDVAGGVARGAGTVVDPSGESAWMAGLEFVEDGGSEGRDDAMVAGWLPVQQVVAGVDLTIRAGMLSRC